MIFILSNDPTETAKALDDRSLNRMIKDIAQVLCNVHHKIGMDWLDTLNTDNRWEDTQKFHKIPLKKTFLEAPGAWEYWARECVANYNYLVELGCLCVDEYRFRFSVIHTVNGILYIPKKIKTDTNAILWARDNVPDLPRHVTNLSPTEYMTNGIYSQDTVTPFPLVMPKKYFIMLKKIIPNPDPDQLEIVDRIQSYRIFYQAKLKQNKKDYLPTWTKREPPGHWL